MLGKTHIVNSLAIASIPLASGIVISKEYLLFLLLVALGSVIPDIDEPNSILGRKMQYLSYPINIFFGHRTITHNIILWVVIAIFLFIQKYIYLLAVSIGILLHLLQDSITYQGIKNGLFPLQRFGYNFVLLPRIFRFAVGSITEKIIFIISIMFLFIVAYMQITLLVR